MGLLLKVLSGPHQGAEFDIPEEDVVIGAADNCDVIVDDVLVANRHVKIKLQGDRVEVTPLEGNVFVEGKLLREPAVIDNFQFITIGSTHMMIGESGSEQWSTLALDKFPELEKIAEEVATFESEDGAVIETDESSTPGDQESAVEGKELEERDSNMADGIGEGAKIKYTFKQRLIRYSAMFAVCAAISVAVSVGYVLYRDRPVVVPPEVVPLDVQIQNAINALPIKSKIKVSTSTDGITVVGYVSTLEESAAVKKAVKEISDSVTVKLKNTEKILASAQEIIQDSKQALTIKAGEEFGTFRVFGYIKKVSVWEEIKAELSAIKGIVKLQDEVLTQNTAIELAKNVLTEYKLQDNLEVTADDSGVSIKGTISDNEKEKWGEAKDSLQKSFKKKAQLSFNISVSTDRNLTIEKFFGGKIDSVNFSNQGLDWINLKNGNKYFQGSVLPSGYVIDQIEQDSVTIKNAEEVIKLDLEWM